MNHFELVFHKAIKSDIGNCDYIERSSWPLISEDRVRVRAISAVYDLSDMRDEPLYRPRLCIIFYC